MDPLTLLALANGAVAAIKKGCQLYKDIKGAAGDVKDVIKDLEQQFKEKTKDKPPSRELKQQFEEEKQRVIETSKADPSDVMAKIADQLGDFFDAMDKIEEIFWEEERKSKALYTGDVSLSRRALQRVMIRTRLEQMEVDLREQMIYHVPADLKDVWTRFNAMRKDMDKEQKIYRAQKIKEDAIKAAKRAKRMENIQFEIAIGIGIIVVIIVMGLLFTFIHYDKKKRWPELETTGEYREQLKKYEVDKIKQALRFLDEQNYQNNKDLINPPDEKR